MAQENKWKPRVFNFGYASRLSLKHKCTVLMVMMEFFFFPTMGTKVLDLLITVSRQFPQNVCAICATQLHYLT